MIVAVDSASAKRVIEDETVMDGDRECVNAVGDVLLSSLFIRIRRSFSVNNYLFKATYRSCYR